eukprot:Seg3516.2 transcript_id=Seg3516.2/GoldUCD/mRNA.D3Y31 product="Ubiquitin thioesterase OTU1" protein_id=Seg3516.2/GoldUCD/D3Y31
MADSLVLRCQFKGGQRKVVDGLTKSSSAAQLQEKLFILTGVAPHRQRILSGFPPKELIISDTNAILPSLAIKSGDTVIVEENKAEPAVKEKTTNFKNQTGKSVLKRHVVPADNSCLFASLSFIIFGGDSSLASEIRNLAAKCIENDSTTFNEAVLGKPTREYCEWLLNPSHWGGAIEITALSKYNETEIDVVDIQTGRIDRFGENEKYKNRVFLIYDGIHYDPLIRECQNKPGQNIQTTFPMDDDSVYAEALTLSQEARQNRQFTDLGGFTLRCLACQKSLVGQVDAQSHAKSTGHTNFGEV